MDQCARLTPFYDGDAPRGADFARGAYNRARRVREARAIRSQLRGFGERESILDVDSEVANGRPDLGMPQEHLHCPQVTGALIPRLSDQNPCAHDRSPIDMMRHG